MSFLLCNDNVPQRTDTAISALPLFYVWIYVSFTLAVGKVVKNTPTGAPAEGSTTWLHFCELCRNRVHYCNSPQYMCTVMEGPIGNILCSLRFWDFFLSGQFVNHLALWGGLDHVS